MPLLVPVINQEGMKFEFLELLRCEVMGWFRVSGTYKATSQTHDAADEKEASVTLLSYLRLDALVRKPLGRIVHMVQWGPPNAQWWVTAIEEPIDQI